MANRKTTFLLKGSSVPGKIPISGDLQLKEIAINFADVILYASGTTANSILPIGWDRLARTGDTMTGTLYSPSISATTISATTYFGLPEDVYVTGGTYNSGTTTFTNNTGGTFSVSGFSETDTYVTGVTISNGVLTIQQNQGQTNLTASTVESRSISFNSNDMALNTANRITLIPLVMSATRFGGTGAIDDAGVSFIIPQDYLNTPQFYYTWRSSTTSANIAKIFMDIYTGTTNNLGSLTSSVETLSLTGSPTTANVFLFSPTTSSSLVLSGGDNVHVRIYRDPSDAGDTFTGDLDMINFTFKYNSKS